MIDLQLLIDSNQYTIDETKITFLANKLLELIKMSDYELSLLIVDDKKIRKLNKLHRGKDSPTDVLSFPQIEWKKSITLENRESSQPSQRQGRLLGDIIISLDSTANNANSLGHSISREFCFLLIHGLLHLCGHDHQKVEDEEVMIQQQKKILKLIEKVSDREDEPVWFNCILVKKDLP